MFSLIPIQGFRTFPLSRELNRFHGDIMSAIHLDRAMTAIPVIIFVGVSRVVRMQRTLVYGFFQAVMGMA